MHGMATNPIDRCWTCNRDWAKNRQKLADCGHGFGQKATGGKGGKIYIVTDPSDIDLIKPKPGTLRHAVIQTEPLWIIFGRDMVISLSKELIITSNKTIDGRGTQVASGGMISDSISHYGLRTGSDGDGISLFGAVLLLGGNDSHPEDKIMQVTVAFTHFGKVAAAILQSYPKAIVLLLLLTEMLKRCKILLVQVTKRETSESEWKNWIWKSEGDLLTNGAFFVPSGESGHNFDIT
ncbi:pectate lyase-like protein [Tanacetum coccineum]